MASKYYQKMFRESELVETNLRSFRWEITLNAFPESDYAYEEKISK